MKPNFYQLAFKRAKAEHLIYNSAELLELYERELIKLNTPLDEAAIWFIKDEYPIMFTALGKKAYKKYQKDTP
jgi:hypothetical protein